jgi:NAD(P)H-hydrate epimerase
VKVLTAAQMREVDRRTVELGIPGLILMENAAQRVVELLVEKFSPLEKQRIAVLCGKGNNGGDGFAVARQLAIRFHPQALGVALAGKPEELHGDVATNFQMLRAVGCDVGFQITAEMRSATLVIDALMGTGLQGPAHGQSAAWIHEINTSFPEARIVAVDIPSGLESDSEKSSGESVSADYTVTFTAPKPCQVLSPACLSVGELRVGAIGSPPDLYEKDESIWLSLSSPEAFRGLFHPRQADSNKGMYGHALIVAGARGKTGAAVMSGVGALKAGAGLVTVASAESAIMAIASYAPEVMTEPLAETNAGSVSTRSLENDGLKELLQKKTVAGIGPGMGTDQDTVAFIRRVVDELEMPMVVDADALNAIAGTAFQHKGPRVLTPHPGEMARLIGGTVADVQSDRLGVARRFAQEHRVAVVLKGNRSVIAFPNGQAWINPTGSPAMATGGTGDVLTGILVGLIAQFPNDLELAVLAGVYLHGRSGELGAQVLGEKSFMATDLFQYLPEAIREVSQV